LNVKRFSTLIDRGVAWCNFSAYMGCSETHLDNNVYIELRFINARNLSNSNDSLSKFVVLEINNIFFSLAISSHKKPFHFETNIGSIPRYTRIISVRIGAMINETIIKNISQYCVMDDIKVLFFKKNRIKIYPNKNYQ